MFNKKKVVIFEATGKEKTPVVMRNDHTLAVYTESNGMINKGYHIGIISNDKLCVGDNFAFKIGGLTIPAIDMSLSMGDYLCPFNIHDKYHIESDFHLSRISNHRRIKKIIASTDPHDKLPVPNQQWIDHFVENWNKCNPIKKVMVEYVAVPTEYDNPITNPDGIDNTPDSVYELKVNDDNTIVIRDMDYSLSSFIIIWWNKMMQKFLVRKISKIEDRIRTAFNM